MEKKKYRPKKTIIKVISIVIIAFSIYLLFGVMNEILHMMELQEEAKVAQAELERVQSENEQLSSQKNKLEDPDYVQSFARSNYMLTKDGEQVFYLPGEESDTTDDWYTFDSQDNPF